MNIEVVAIGNKIPKWVAMGFEDYQKRMPSHLNLSLKPIGNLKQSKQESVEKQKNEEGQKILKCITERDYMVALDGNGKIQSSKQLAALLLNWQQLGRNIKIVIGGANGLSDACKHRADQLLSLSALTLPHQLVKLIIAEQLYRAYSINSGHPYHRE